MKIAITQLTAGDYDEVVALWEACEGLGLSDSDSEESIALSRSQPGPQPGGLG